MDTTTNTKFVEDSDFQRPVWFVLRFTRTHDNNNTIIKSIRTYKYRIRVVFFFNKKLCFFPFFFRAFINSRKTHPLMEVFVMNGLSTKHASECHSCVIIWSLCSVESLINWSVSGSADICTNFADASGSKFNVSTEYHCNQPREPINIRVVGHIRQVYRKSVSLMPSKNVSLNP